MKSRYGREVFAKFGGYSTLGSLLRGQCLRKCVQGRDSGQHRFSNDKDIFDR